MDRNRTTGPASGGRPVRRARMVGHVRHHRHRGGSGLRHWRLRPGRRASGRADPAHRTAHHRRGGPGLLSHFRAQVRGHRHHQAHDARVHGQGSLGRRLPGPADPAVRTDQHRPPRRHRGPGTPRVQARAVRHHQPLPVHREKQAAGLFHLRQHQGPALRRHRRPPLRRPHAHRHRHPAPPRHDRAHGRDQGGRFPARSRHRGPPCSASC